MAGGMADQQTIELNRVVESTIERAVEVIGDRDRALRWMGLLSAFCLFSPPSPHTAGSAPQCSG
jgi:hypothetical protein